MSGSATDDGLAARFAAALRAADGTPHLGEEPSSVALAVAGSAPATIAVDDDSALEDLATALQAAGHVVVRPHEPAYRDALPDAALGITRCAAAIADTGTLMLLFDAAHPRSTSLLPRTHVAVVDEADLVASLGEALGRVPTPLPSAVTFVTGPSRSADIEQILTLGVHGPAHVHVVL
ncbi:MAG TPA: LUD domain-containing protein [Acidimicrobiia bacterium]|nr:LUD domain-containing protein [Acidimicrobiia bacterium]